MDELEKNTEPTLETSGNPPESPETSGNPSESPETSGNPSESPETSGNPPKKPMNPKVLGGIVGAVAVVGLSISLFSGGSETSADEMRLEKYVGEMSLQNATVTKEVIEGSRLVSQDNLETFTESSAYISLDKAKVLKLDEESHMEVIKVEDDLDVELYKGSLYFSVTEPLTEMETLEFHTNNVVTGVRGTSGVITYTEDILQSQMVVLSGTVEVTTIEEEPETVMVHQGEVAIATTQEDGSVTLDVKQQEKTPSYLFSTNFLDDSGEEVEVYTLPDWKEAYIELLNNLEQETMEHQDIMDRLNHQTEYKIQTLHPVDFSATTYWLHDWNLDGIPELFLQYHFPTRGFVPSGYNDDLHKHELSYLRGCYFSDGELRRFWSDYMYSIEIMDNGELNGRQEYVYAVPSSGIGLYRQRVDDYYGHYAAYTHLYITDTDFVEYMDDRGLYQPMLEGTPIQDYTWTHYTDLSGLEWDG